MSGNLPDPTPLVGPILADPTRMDGQELKTLVEAATVWVKANQQTINALNVFPVPDGDTGTNMLLTMQAACNEIVNSGERNIGKMVHAVAQGSLMGARGNSGVILSQIWRGFARAMDNQETMDSVSFAASLEEAKVTAYKGVVRPVEGTILTVAKDIADAAVLACQGNPDLVDMLEQLVAAADVSVKKTPELLPILKQAGVVDAGGKGLYFIFDGMLRHLRGLSLVSPAASLQPLSTMLLEKTMEEIEPGQDFEVVVDFKPNTGFNLNDFYSGLSEIGTSIQVGEGDGMYRMHIHVAEDKCYDPIDFTRERGTVTKVAIENLIQQMDERGNQGRSGLSLPNVQPGQIAVVAVSPGLGISRIFASLGAAAIVEGGQTMNPSTEMILKAIENLPTDKIIILPNNKNIIMTAQTASGVAAKRVAVIPTSSVPQGLSAILRLNPDSDIDLIEKEMNNALKDVETGEITTGTRSVEMDGVNVKEGQVVALLNGKLVQASSTLVDACLGLLEKANTIERERITIFYGANITRDEVDQIIDKLREVYPSHEFEVHEGGQPHYQFILSIE